MRLQVVAPVQAPLQPEKTLLAAGVAVSVTLVFCGKLALHVVGQLIPAGLWHNTAAVAGHGDGQRFGRNYHSIECGSHVFSGSHG